MGDKIINFTRGSKFYFQRGNYYYQKNNLDEALDWYRRALAVDPGNPVNHFHVACLLSELGRYPESSTILERLVTEVDSGFSESWFWLAMNSGQQQQYKKSAKYLRKYLEQDPEGEYSLQAQEILEYMRSDMPMVNQDNEKTIEDLCTKGIQLVNQGNLQKAIGYFNQASEIEPELTSPKNNLALSWFYLGDVNRAIDITRDVLKSEPENIFANCNLATFYYVAKDRLGVQRQVRVLDELWTDDPDEMIKLGTTYGLLGMDKRALILFRALLDLGNESFELLLLLGIASNNCGLYKTARKIFRSINETHPAHPYQEYLDMVGMENLPYHLRVPNPVMAEFLETNTEEVDVAFFDDNPKLWPQLMWMVENSSVAVGTRIISAIIQTGHKPLSNMLSAMVWDWDIDINCRRSIYTALTNAGYPLWSSKAWPNIGLTGNASAVLEGALEELFKSGHGFDVLNHASVAWTRYCKSESRRIRSLNLWKTALVVFALGLDQLNEQAKIAGLTPGQVKKAVISLMGLVPTIK